MTLFLEAAATTAQSGAGGMVTMLIPLLLMFGLMYLLRSIADIVCACRVWSA